MHNPGNLFDPNELHDLVGVGVDLRAVVVVLSIVLCLGVCLTTVASAALASVVRAKMPSTWQTEEGETRENEKTVEAELTKETSFSNSTRAEDEPEANYAKWKAAQKAKRDAASGAKGAQSSSTLRRRASAQEGAASLEASLESSSPATTKLQCLSCRHRRRKPPQPPLEHQARFPRPRSSCVLKWQQDLRRGLRAETSPKERNVRATEQRALRSAGSHNCRLGFVSSITRWVGQKRILCNAERVQKRGYHCALYMVYTNVQRGGGVREK